MSVVTRCYTCFPRLSGGTALPIIIFSPKKHFYLCYVCHIQCPINDTVCTQCIFIYVGNTFDYNHYTYLDIYKAHIERNVYTYSRAFAFSHCPTEQIPIRALIFHTYIDIIIHTVTRIIMESFIVQIFLCFFSVFQHNAYFSMCVCGSV